MSEQFIKCKNCGVYIPEDKAVYNKYCSENCIRLYNTCRICGKYFIHDQGYDEYICSKECSITYKITKLYKNET